MSIDQAIILAAGYGTRMGDIGKILPKVMWPLYEYSLLESQVLFAKSLGIKKVYINTFHQAELIQVSEEIQKEIKVEFVNEEILLGSGGGIQNILAKSSVEKNKPVLVLNSDLFFMINKESIQKTIEEIEQKDDVAVALYPVKCLPEDAYNRLELESNLLKRISKKDENSPSDITYSGVSIILPWKIKPQAGESAFFTSVANFKEEPVYVCPVENWEYWDFGTAELYKENIFRSLKKENESTDFFQFLVNQKIFNETKRGSEDNSYGINEEDACQFLGEDFYINDYQIHYKNITQMVD